MSPKYQEIGREDNVTIDGRTGTLITVLLIPVIDGVEDPSQAETQKYFVAEGESVAEVLSRAAWNHEDTLNERNQVSDLDVVENPVVEAMPKDQLS